MDVIFGQRAWANPEAIVSSDITEHNLITQDNMREPTTASGSSSTLAVRTKKRSAVEG